jgi:hypothetical protein
MFEHQWDLVMGCGAAAEAVAPVCSNREQGGVVEEGEDTEIPSVETD